MKRMKWRTFAARFSKKSADVNRFESLFEHLFRRDFFTELDHRTQLVFSQIRQDIQLKLDQVYTEVGNGMQNKAYQLLHEKSMLLMFAL